jgi:hypothetical protein
MTTESTIIVSDRRNKCSEIKQIESKWNKGCRKGFVNVKLLEIKRNKAHAKILLSEKRWPTDQAMGTLRVQKL